jgi:mRNA interferase MazF
MRKRTVTYEPWSVVTVPFPFTDSKISKKRPAVVLSTESFEKTHGHVVMAMITSAKHSDWPTDVLISDQQAAGLSAPSVVRFKMFTLDARLILNRVGTLAERDRSRVHEELRSILAP